MKKYFNLVLLSIIPFGIFLYGILFLKSLNKLFISWTDPVYAYLFNGLNLASGKLVIGHVDHPGTPVQCFSALIIKFVHLFRGDTPLVSDVLTHPEIYISAICHSILLLVCLVTFLIGYSILKKSGLLWKGLFFQSTPVLSFETLHHTSILMTEPFLIIAILFLVLQAFLYNLKETTFKEDFKFSLLFGWICGFAMAVKISSAPLLFIPLLLLNRWKNKFVFLGTCIIAFFLFILPALSELRTLKYFILGIIKHTGRYGKGAEGFINFSEFKTNCFLLFTKDWVFPLCYAILITSLVIALFTDNWSNLKKNKIFRLLTGIFAAMTVQIILVSKHYSSHYLIPAYCLMGLAFYFSFMQLRKVENTSNPYKGENWKTAAVVLLAIAMFGRTSLKSNFIEFRNNPDYVTNDFLLFYAKTPRIIVDTDYSSPMVEQALYFGWAYSGKLQKAYSIALDSLYPNSYFYAVSGNFFYGWQFGKKLLLRDLLSKNPKMLLYINHQENFCKNTIFEAIKMINQEAAIAVSAKEIFRNKENSDVIYELVSDTTQMAASLKSKNKKPG